MLGVVADDLLDFAFENSTHAGGVQRILVQNAYLDVFFAAHVEYKLLVPHRILARILLDPRLVLRILIHNRAERVHFAIPVSEALVFLL